MPNSYKHMYNSASFSYFRKSGNIYIYTPTLKHFMYFLFTHFHTHTYYTCTSHTYTYMQVAPMQIYAHFANTHAPTLPNTIVLKLLFTYARYLPHKPAHTCPHHSQSKFANTYFIDISAKYTRTCMLHTYKHMYTLPTYQFSYCPISLHYNFFYSRLSITCPTHNHAHTMLTPFFIFNCTRIHTFIQYIQNPYTYINAELIQTHVQFCIFQLLPITTQTLNMYTHTKVHVHLLQIHVDLANTLLTLTYLHFIPTSRIPATNQLFDSALRPYLSTIFISLISTQNFYTTTKRQLFVPLTTNALPHKASTHTTNHLNQAIPNPPVSPIPITFWSVFTLSYHPTLSTPPRSGFSQQTLQK